jgi:gluconokinase
VSRDSDMVFEAMRVLCFDISTGGLARAVFDENLVAYDMAESPWHITMDAGGAAVLTADALETALRRVMSQKPASPVDAISSSGFMHSSLILNGRNQPLTPIFTWMDRRGGEAVDRFRKRFASEFHKRTGCRFHPMFPVFKTATFRQAGLRRVVSAKSLVIALLTGSWVEDHGTASATGFYNTRNETWDTEILDMIPLDSSALPDLVERETIVGRTTVEAANSYGIDSGVSVIAGSGDGFLANLGSGCEDPGRMAVTLGTSSSVRQVLPTAVLDDAAGTFCYRADKSKYLLGCASNNGGNVLDWARSIFASLPGLAVKATQLPTFIPLLNGERSPEWDPALKASWHGIEARHTAQDLASSVVDGVVFNLAHYVEIIERASGVPAKQFVLSGNGFLNGAACETFAAVFDREVLRPRHQGLASLRGAAVCAFRALGVDSAAHLERVIQESERVRSDGAPEIRERYRRYRTIREVP